MKSDCVGSHPATGDREVPHARRVLVIAGAMLSIFVATLSNTAAQPSQFAGGNDERAHRADALFGRLSESTPGCAMAVLRKGAIVYEHAYGMANIELGTPLTSDSVIGIDSMSKQFTAMGVVLLVLRGKLSLDDEIHKYIPELPDYGHAITIQQLLHHTSGIKNANELLKFAGFRPPFNIQTKQMYLDIIVRQHQLNFIPGSEYLYSDSNYFLLGLIVERVSGETLPAFMRREIFQPLGMSHTQVRDDSSRVIPGRAFGYNKGYDENSSDGFFHDADAHIQALGSDGVFTTTADFARWDHNFDEEKVGGERALELMLQTRKLNNGADNQYAAGLEIGSYRGLRTVGHDGGGFGTSSDFLRFPDQQASFVVLCNFRDSDEHDRELLATSLARRLADIYLQGEFPAPPNSSSPRPPEPTPSEPQPADDAASLGAFVGFYWDRQTTVVRKFDVKDGRLRGAVLPFGEPRDLESLGSGRFRLGPASITFGRSGGEVEFSQPGVAPVRLWRVPPPADGRRELEAFAGSFYSFDIDSSWRFAVKENRLVLQRKDFPDEDMIPAFRNAFFCGVADGALIHFVGAHDAHITHADVMNRYLRQISFAKARNLGQ